MLIKALPKKYKAHKGTVGHTKSARITRQCASRCIKKVGRRWRSLVEGRRSVWGGLSPSHSQTMFPINDPFQ